MSNEMLETTRIFNNNMFGKIRTMIISGEPYFVGMDIAMALGYSNTRDALAKHTDEEDKATVAIYDGRQKRNVTAINESGLYSLILSSKLPSARAFKRWVTSEVLPEIRKTGGYSRNGYVITNNQELIARALIQAQQIISEMQPKALYADIFQNGRITINEFAGVMKRNGINTNSIKMYAWMRKNGYLVESGDRYNLPTEWAARLGLFEEEDFSYGCPDKGAVRKKVYITGAGQQYFVELFMTIKDNEQIDCLQK